MKKFLTILIIAGLFLAGFSNAEVVEEDTFRQRLKKYLQKAWQKVYSVLEGPLNVVKDWSKAKLQEVESNFYAELEEMKVSFLDLFKWAWKEGTKEVEKEL